MGAEIAKKRWCTRCPIVDEPLIFLHCAPTAWEPHPKWQHVHATSSFLLSWSSPPSRPHYVIPGQGTCEDGRRVARPDVRVRNIDVSGAEIQYYHSDLSRFSFPVLHRVWSNSKRWTRIDQIQVPFLVKVHVHTHHFDPGSALVLHLVKHSWSNTGAAAKRFKWYPAWRGETIVSGDLSSNNKILNKKVLSLEWVMAQKVQV